MRARMREMENGYNSYYLAYPSVNPVLLFSPAPVQMLFCPVSRTSSGLRGSLSGRTLEECVYGKEAEKIVTAHRLVGGGVIGTRGGSLVWNAG